MTRRGLLARVTLAVVLAAAVNLTLELTTQRHDYVLVTLIVFAVTAVVELVASAVSVTAPITWRTARPTEAAAPTTEGTLARYQRLLERQRVSRDPDDSLQRQLLALAERRLQQRHGLTPDTDPDEVELRLGPILGDLLVSPRLTPHQVNRIIDRIEEL
jgi:signal transduction histidine kinase